MEPVDFPEANDVLAKNQPEYLPLPVHRVEEGRYGEVISCWRFTWRERFAVLFGAPLWLSQLTFGQRLQPQKPQLESPFHESGQEVEA